MNSSQTLYRITNLIWYIFYIIEMFLLVRFALKLFGANPDVAFTHFVYGISQTLIAPFEYVFGVVPSGNGGVIDMNALLAVVVYWFVAWAVVSLLSMGHTFDQTETTTTRELRTQDNGPY